MKKRSVLSLSLAAAAGAAAMVVAAPANARPAGEAPLPDDAQARCKSLNGLEIAVYADAEATLAGARVVNDKPALAPYCEISGFVTPQVGFEARLPLSNWNGRFLMQGCRGLCGIMPTDTANDALARGYAIGTTDMGHKAASSRSGIWLVNNPQGKTDFGHRGTHVATRVIKEVIATFYGSPSRFSYFRGCGTGGRQGFVSAQRYPQDFDGIITNGAGVLDYVGNVSALIWNVRTLSTPDGRSVLTDTDIDLLHRKVIAACDRDDGLDDGEITRPLACRFSPRELACKGGATSGCLSDAKIVAVERMYQGPRTSGGTPIYPGVLPGSELTWNKAYQGSSAKYREVMRGIGGYLVHSPPKGPDWAIDQWNFDVPRSYYGESELTVGVNSLDYADYAARGGKLLTIWGWNEPSMPGAFFADYYARLVRASGGLDPTQKFFRAYMVGGDYHCAEGVPHGVHFDALTAIEDWVERGRAPDAMTGHVLVKEPAYPEQVRFPVQAQDVKRSRSYFPYPDTSVYRGSGPQTEPSSYARRRGELPAGQRAIPLKRGLNAAR